MPSKKVLVVDDHPVVRDGVKLLLRSDPALVVAASVESGLAAIPLVRQLQPDRPVWRRRSGSSDHELWSDAIDGAMRFRSMSAASTSPADSVTVRSAVAILISGCAGGSYGSSTPVSPDSVPARCFA
jgi:hypothetical protein